MDHALLIVTIASLAAAAGCGAVAWRALAEQRRRASARIAALASAIDADGTTPAAPTAGAGAHREAARDQRAASRTAPRDGEDLAAGRSASVGVSSMFATVEGGSLKGRPLIKAAVVASMAVALIVIVAMASRERVEATDPVTERAPLELVAMRHSRDGGALTVAGLVRNPRAGVTVARITAVVSAFDRHGALVTSASAPLDFTTLEPGDESPFVVTIPNAPDVARYRVGFRTEDGALRHMDRRAA